MKLATFTKTGTKSKTPVEGSKKVFGVEVNQPLLSQAVRIYLSNQRQGTSRAKTRGEVVRTKKKWYKQKGTGNARHGARSAHIFVGGGVAHGPTGYENWKKKLSTKLKHQAMASALSAQSDNILIWDGLNGLTGKTKEASALLSKLVAEKDKVLLVVDEIKPNVMRAVSNLPRVLVTRASHLNVYEVSLADKIILTKDSLKVLEERLEKTLK